MTQINTHIDISASDQNVWKILTTLNEYELWNPLIPWAQGDVKEKSQVHMRIAPPGLAKRNLTVVILTVKPLQEFRWLGRFIITGLLDGEHVFLIEPIGTDKVRLTQSEYFSGLLVPLLSRWLVPRMLLGFETMNEALKIHAEQLQQKSSGRNGHSS